MSSIPSIPGFTPYLLLLVPRISSLYLVFDNMSFQVFNTLTEELGNSTAIPSPLKLHRHCPWVTMEGKLLCLVKDNSLWTWDMDANTASHTPEKPKGLICATTQGITLLLGKEMYWMGIRKNMLYKFDLEKLRYHQRLLKGV